MQPTLAYSAISGLRIKHMLGVLVALKLLLIQFIVPLHRFPISAEAHCVVVHVNFHCDDVALLEVADLRWHNM